MSEAVLLQNYLLVGAALFGIGLVGLVTRRNMIVMFLSAEMMLQGASVNLVAWSRFHNDWDGQILVIFILTVAACEAAIALALFVMLYYWRGNLDILSWQQLREESVPQHVDHELPEPEPQPPERWPSLTPSGVAPPEDRERESHRPRV